MRFITMGSEAFPTLLFIPGLSATAESCYGKVGRSLQDHWHIVLCELDGHYDGSPAFRGIDDACEQIEAYVQLTAQAMVIDLDPIEGQFEEKDGTLVFGDGDPIEYTLSGDTLSFTFDEFGELVFERIG